MLAYTELNNPFAYYCFMSFCCNHFLSVRLGACGSRCLSFNTRQNFLVFMSLLRRVLVANASTQGENVDYCAACGGNGELLCCDGCTRAFHFRCLDPPMTSNQPPEGEWFCFNCDAKQNARTKPSRGLFSGLMHRLEKQNPVAFSLPTPIREYFEGVKTGEEGEYEEVSTAKNK